MDMLRDRVIKAALVTMRSAWSREYGKTRCDWLDCTT
jgi:hypothetical protein